MSDTVGKLIKTLANETLKKQFACSKQRVKPGSSNKSYLLVADGRLSQAQIDQVKALLSPLCNAGKLSVLVRDVDGFCVALNGVTCLELRPTTVSSEASGTPAA